MAEYTRPGGFRFIPGGANTRSTPDALPPDKYTYLQNVRGTSLTSLRTRPGYVPSFVTGGKPVTDLKALTSLNTDASPRTIVIDSGYPAQVLGDGNPRIIARDSSDSIWLDTGAQIGSLTRSNGPGASMIAYRPNASPAPWMYICNGADYQKFSSPGISDVVHQQKVGIAEPQAAPEAQSSFQAFNEFSPLAAGWTADGVFAGAVSDQTRITDTAGVAILDPANTDLMSVNVSAIPQYQVGMALFYSGIGGGATPFTVLDVIPAPSTTATITINAIFYFSGATGPCVIVPSQCPVAGSIPSTLGGAFQGASSVFADQVLGSFRRGSLITLSGGSETVLVLSVTKAPDGTISLECSTTGTHVSGETITGLQTVVTNSNADTVTGVQGSTITSKCVQSSISGTTGTSYATLTAPIATNPFNKVYDLFSVTPQSADYLHFSIKVSDLSLLTQGIIYLNVNGDTSDVTYTTEVYYYIFNPANILGLPNVSTLTPSPSNQWTEIEIPISSFQRLGTDLTQTLSNFFGMRVALQLTGACTVQLASFWVGGSGQLDVGTSGSPYFYSLVPRSSLTGATGNPSPISRYGVSPRRQNVAVTTPTTYSDPQVDTWDVYRYGGTITSFRYTGSVPLATGVFSDSYFDTALTGTSVIDYTNFEPWPSIDLPFNVTPGTDSAGITWTVQSIGTTMVIMASKGSAFTNPFPLLLPNWLPGTLFIIGTQQAYTLWNRPTIYTPSAPPTYYYAYLFRFVESLGYSGSLASPGSGLTVEVNEPVVANQPLPYAWGPDAYGTVFACGDPLRLGTVYWTKPFQPDSAPDTNNLEITSPSEPLLGGQVVAGISLISSPQRWWALIFQPGNTVQPYYPVEQPVTRGSISPYGSATDGKVVYFWAKDGIWDTSGKCHTDLDLYNLFPHEGVTGSNVTSNSFTFYAPDYKRAGEFRLCFANSYLYADYQDLTGTQRTLILDLRTGSWSTDVYADSMRVHYHPEQQAGTVLSDTTLYPALLLADINGKVWVQRDLHNDDTVTIPCAVSTFEFDAGDMRASEQWGDLELDAIPASGLTVTPISNGAQASPPITIAPALTRTQSPISLAGGLLARYLGLLITWSDDFAHKSIPTSLLIWQPSFVPKPETITDRAGDWDDAGTPDAKFFQGFELRADTFNALKLLTIQDSDSLATHVIQPSPIRHNGEQTKAYSFATPFVAHLVRDVPQDQVQWRRFGIKWVYQPTPENVETWQTQATSFGLSGFSHIQRIIAAYTATADVILTITAFDGTSPAPLTLPSTGGLYKKVLFVLTFNKGQLFTFSGISTSPWQAFLDDWEIMVGNWGRPNEYLNYRSLGGPRGDKATI